MNPDSNAIVRSILPRGFDRHPKIGGDLVGAQPRLVRVNLCGDHQFVGAGALDKGLQGAAHGLWRADGGAGEHAVEQFLFLRAGVLVKAFDRRRQFFRAVAAQVDERLLRVNMRANLLVVADWSFRLAPSQSSQVCPLLNCEGEPSWQLIRATLISSDALNRGIATWGPQPFFRGRFWISVNGIFTFCISMCGQYPTAFFVRQGIGDCFFHCFKCFLNLVFWYS